MKKIVCLFEIILLCLSTTAQVSYYYFNGNRIYLNENPLVRYVEIIQSASSEQVEEMYELLSSCCWRTDEYSTHLTKYYIIQNKLPEFMQICFAKDSIICLHISNYADSDTSIFYPTRSILVKIKTNVNIYTALFENNIPFINVMQSKYNENEYSIYLPNDSALSYAARLYETGLFAYAEPDFVGVALPLGYEDNPKFIDQWAVHNQNTNINLLSAWGVTTGDPEIKVAIVDSGVDLEHPDLVNNLLEGYDAVNDSQHPSTVCCGSYESVFDWHGTCCAGIVGAENNNIGIVGIAHTSKIIPLRYGHSVLMRIRTLPPHDDPIEQWVWLNQDSWIVDALNHACYEDSADVINCSFSMLSQSEPILGKVTEICEQGRDGKGCVVVASAGNTYLDNSLPIWDTLGYLSRHPSVISVGSVTPCGERVKKGTYCQIKSSYNSCYGDSLDVVAPGIHIPTTIISIDSEYTSAFAGTSSAAPHVAGVAALILSVNPCLTREEVKYVIESTCTKIRSDLYEYDSNPDHPNGTWNVEVGHGLVNAGAAIELVQQMSGYIYVNDTLISTDTVWDTNRLIHQNLVIDSLRTLTITDTVFCTSSSRIIVRPGGKLIVDGGTLTSACAGEMWQGVYVEGHRDQPQTAANQGTVQLLNGAVVENAIKGIRTSAPGSGWNTTGGIITADNATFRNCAKAVEYLSYAGTNYAGQVVDNKGSFTNCTFTVDDNNLFAANGTDLLAHVSLWDVKGVEFTHCRFEDARTGNHSRKSAISALDAGFEMKTGCSYNVPRPECDCPPASSTHSSFAGFGTAIDAGTSGSPYGIVIDGAQFSDNITGVRIGGSSHATVTRCTFDLSDMPVRVVSGLCLDGCTGYLVEGNTFTRGASAPNGSRYGIRVGNSGTDANRLYRNTFERLSHGIYVTGTNRDGNSNTGLQMTCNGFTSNTYDIYVASGATVGPSQGDNSKGADNTFSGTQTSSLYNAGNSGIDYYYSTGTNHSPQNPVGNVTLHTNAGSNDCASTLCVLDPSNPGPGPKSPTPSFLALKQQYENLMADFNRNGYADILSTAIPPLYGGTPNVNQETIEAAQYASQQINSIAAELYAQSHAAVRALMADTLEDLQAVVAWLDATPGLASRYLEAETEFKLGGNNISLADIANHIATPEERDEYDNYLAFNGLKEALRYGNGHVAWINATDAQIGELIRIADANTGRSSLLAKNVLCFFFGICYDDTETRALETTTIPPTAESPTLTGQQNITVHPNPTNDVLHVTVTDGNAKIARVEMFDMFGRNISVKTHGRASLPSPQTTVNTSDIPSGLYLLRVTLTDGTVRNVKVVRR